MTRTEQSLSRRRAWSNPDPHGKQTTSPPFLNMILFSAWARPAQAKTYLAVACAVAALKRKEVSRIILTRPAVEAGENLGFLPGDIQDKVDPYLRPLYDALRDMVPGDQLAQLMQVGTFEIAPLAFMRGRTLNNAFVILDEAQNTSIAQMKMFLTRLGAKFTGGHHR